MKNFNVVDYVSCDVNYVCLDIDINDLCNIGLEHNFVLDFDNTDIDIDDNIEDSKTIFFNGENDLDINDNIESFSKELANTIPKKYQMSLEISFVKKDQMSLEISFVKKDQKKKDFVYGIVFVNENKDPNVQDFLKQNDLID